MIQLSQQEKEELLRLIEAGELIPERWRARLFPGSARGTEIGKEYRLVYEGKIKREIAMACDKLTSSLLPPPRGGQGCRAVPHSWQ